MTTREGAPAPQDQPCPDRVEEILARDADYVHSRLTDEQIEKYKAETRCVGPPECLSGPYRSWKIGQFGKIVCGASSPRGD